jgi:two-component system osmolarity sensor histidine kinase EnvZ
VYLQLLLGWGEHGLAGGGSGEVAVDLPLDELLAELAAQYDDPPLALSLTPLRATVQPTAISRAVANLVDNAFSYGQPPVRLKLVARLLTTLG